MTERWRICRVEAPNLAPLPDNVDFTVGASLPISGLTRGRACSSTAGCRRAAGDRARRCRRGRIDGETLAREFGGYVIGTGRAATSVGAHFGANEFVDLDDETLEDVGEVDLVFDLIGGRLSSAPPASFDPGGRW